MPAWTPETDCRRSQCIQPRMGLRTHACRSRQDRSHLYGRYGPPCRSYRCRSARKSREICPHRNIHHPQDTARPPRRYNPYGRGLPQPMGQKDSERRNQDDVSLTRLGRIPRCSGRSARTCHRRKSRGFPRSSATRVHRLSEAGETQCFRHGRGSGKERL